MFPLAAGDVIAVGSQNGSVYLFRVSRDGYSYKRAHKIRGSQPLTQLDWSTDGGFLQTATEDYDLTFCKDPTPTPTPAPDPHTLSYAGNNWARVRAGKKSTAGKKMTLISLVFEPKASM